MNPKVETVKVDNISLALIQLEQSWCLPDGTEVSDYSALKEYRRQISKGYYYRLTWPTYATRINIEEWFQQAEYVLMLRSLGLV